MKIIDFKKIIGYFNTHGADSFEIDARRDWKIIIISFSFFLLAILFVDGYVFLKFSSVLEEKIETEDKKTITIDKASLDKVLENISEREKRFEESLQSVKIKDPSL